MSKKRKPRTVESLINSHNPLLKKLGEAMKEHNREWPDKKITPQTIVDITGIKDQDLFTGRGKYPDSSARPLELPRVALLFMLVKADPEKTFLMDKEAEADWLAKNRSLVKNNHKPLFTWEKWREIEKTWGKRKLYLDFWKDIYNPTKKKNKELKRAYKKLAERYYREAHSSIVAHELLFKGNNKAPNKYKAYTVAQEQILEEIETQLSNKPGLKYKRNFYFSLSDDLPFKESRSSWGKAFINEASKITLEHVYKCLTKFPDQCEFKFTTSASFRHKVIIDDHYMLIEDYAIFDEMIVPESICVLDVRKRNETHVILELTEETEDERRFEHISALEIRREVTKVFNFIEKELKVRKTLKDDIDNNILKVEHNEGEDEAQKKLNYAYERLSKELSKQIKTYQNMVQSLDQKKKAIYDLT